MMINVTVVNKRQLGKYFFKTIIMLLIIIIFYNIFFVQKDNNVVENNILRDYTLTECLDKTIVLIANIKNKEYNIEGELKSLEPYKLALRMQLAAIENLKIKKEDISKSDNKTQNTEIQNSVVQAQTGLSTEVLKNNVPNKYTNSYSTVQIKNESKYDLTEEMLKPDVEINNKNVLIFHTHTCESYTATEKFNYTQTGTYRTTDFEYNVVRVGTELENQLKSYNYNVIHDRTYHDYPSYSGSYGRSLETVKKLLAQNKDTDIVIDLHRDAIGDYSYAPTVKIGEDYAAQLMFVIGTDGGGLEHENWVQNLKFAVKIQEKANEMYPGLFKPIILRNTRYNQHLAKGASIIEVGATGNTMEQCLTSMKYLSKVLSEVI